MTSDHPFVGVVGCAAGGVEQLREQLVLPLLERGYRVGVTLTPTAAVWLDESGELTLLEEATGLPVRSAPRLPNEASPHSRSDCWVVAPATANMVAKLALGISDNQALTQVNESIGTVPTVIFPRINAAHARHPSWGSHLDALRRAGVNLVYGDEVWRLHEPRQAPSNRPLPWAAVLAMVERAVR